MTTVERVGEGLARQLNRRQTLKRAAVAVFGAVAAWTVEGFRGNSALAQQCGVVTEATAPAPRRKGSTAAGWTRRFAPASACAGDCYYDESYRYAGACWCSATCQYDGGESGYYHCCDCNCYGQLCACHEFISTGYSEAPVPPRAERPGPPSSALPGFGDDEPQLPPGVPPCFPFCD